MKTLSSAKNGRRLSAPARLPIGLFSCILSRNKLWNLWLILLAAWWPHYVFKQIAPWVAQLTTDEEGAGVYSQVALSGMSVFGAAFGTGAVASDSLFKLLSSHASWFTKGLRQALRRDTLLLMGLLVALTAPLAMGAWPSESLGFGGTPQWGLLVVVPIAFSIGLEIFRYSWGGLTLLVFCTSGVAICIGIEQVLAWSNGHLWVALPIGFAVFAAVINRKFSANLHFHQVRGDSIVVSRSKQDPRQGPGDFDSFKHIEKKARPSAVAIQGESTAHLRLFGFASWGWQKTLYKYGRILPAAVAIVLTVLMVGVFALLALPEPYSWFEFLYAATWNPDHLGTLGETAALIPYPSEDGMQKMPAGTSIRVPKLIANHSQFIMPLMIATVVAISSLYLQPRLKHGCLHALSRSDRAELLAKGSLRNLAYALFGIASTFLVLSLAAGLASGVEFGPAPPYWLLTCAIAFVMLPLLQFAAVILNLYPTKAPSNKFFLLLAISLHIESFFVILVATISKWLAYGPSSDGGPGGAWAIIALLLAIAGTGQVFLARFYKRRFAKIDLI